MLTKRDVVRLALTGQRPPYVPWSFGFTAEARTKLEDHWGAAALEDQLQNHLLGLGNGIGFFENIGNDSVRDVFGVVWDRSVDKDIGIVRGCVLPEPTLNGYRFPAFFELNLHLERKFVFRANRWAFRFGFNNITGHNNPNVVINDASAPNFLAMYGGQSRALNFRIRWLGKN